MDFPNSIGPLRKCGNKMMKIPAREVHRASTRGKQRKKQFKLSIVADWRLLDTPPAKA